MTPADAVFADVFADASWLVKRALLVLVAGLVGFGCGGTAAPDTPQRVNRDVARSLTARCPRASVTADEAAVPPPQVFIELGVFQTSADSAEERAAPERLLSAPGTTLVQTLHVLADSGVATGMPISSKEGAESVFRVTPSFEDASNVSLAIVYGASHTTVRVPEEQPLVLPLSDGHEGGARVGILVARFVRTKEDLRRINECKEHLASARPGT